MRAYERFPIADFSQGMFLAKQPWASPSSTWRDIRNGHVFRGRLQKRPGFQTYGGLGTAETGETQAPVLFSTEPGWKVYADTALTGTPIIAPYKVGDTSTYRFYMSVYIDGAEEKYYDTGQKIVDFPGGVEAYLMRREGDPDEFMTDYDWGFLVRDTGGFFFRIRDSESITSHPLAPTGAPPHNVKLIYDYLDGDAVMGIITYQDETGSDVTLACSEGAMFRWNSSQERFEKLSNDAGVTFTGDDSQFFSFEPFGDILIATNGADRPIKYDSTASPPVILMGTDYTGGGAYIRSAKAVLRYKGRLLYFAIDDDGTGVKQGRVRWTSVGNAEGFDRATDYLDAPTNDPFVSVQLLGDRIMVAFKRSWWELESTQDPRDPFRWVRIPSDQGAVSLQGGVAFSDALVFRTDVAISSIDGLGQSPVDNAIPDFTVGWNPDATQYTYAVRYDQLRQVWWSYADREEDKPGHVLVMQREPNSIAWSRWDLAGVHVFGDTRNASSLLWDDVYQAWNDVEWSWDSPDLSSGFPQVLVGKRDGSIVIVTSDSDDDGFQVTFEAESQRLSPYPGLRTRFGYVDIQADASSGDTLTVRFRRDFETSDFKAETVDLTPENGTEEKVVRRVMINADALFLTMSIEQTGTAGFAADWFELWAKPSGRLREVA